MRQPRFERGTFGSGGDTGRRPPTLAVVVSGTYASRASASASQRQPRCYRRCYHASLLVADGSSDGPVRRLGVSAHLAGHPPGCILRRNSDAVIPEA